MALGTVILAGGIYSNSLVRDNLPSASLTLEEAVGQMLVIGFRGESLDREILTVLKDIKPGGVVLFDYDFSSKGEEIRNIISPEQLRALNRDLQETSSLPYFIALDAEGGYVNRLKEKYGFSVVVPSAKELGAQSPDQTKEIATELAVELKDMGINWNFAPVVDVNINAESPAIGAIERSFSNDPAIVAAHANAFIKAHQEQNIIPTLKHFPGHGSARGDTHLGIVDVTKTYQVEKELAPYQELIGNGYDLSLIHI